MINARFARKPIAGLFAGGAWTKIRVAVFLDLVNSLSPLSSAQLYMGLCSGTTNIPGDATPTNAIGLTTTGTWTYYSVSAPQYQFYGTVYPRRIVAGVQTDGTFLDNMGIATDTNSIGPSMIFCDITKGSPNFSVRLYCLKQASSNVGINETVFEQQSVIDTPSLFGGNYVNAAAQTLAFDEANGTLDAAFVYWNLTQAIRIRQLRVIKLA